MNKTIEEYNIWEKEEEEKQEQREREEIEKREREAQEREVQERENAMSLAGMSEEEIRLFGILKNFIESRKKFCNLEFVEGSIQRTSLHDTTEERSNLLCGWGSNPTRFNEWRKKNPPNFVSASEWVTPKYLVGKLRDLARALDKDFKEKLDDSIKEGNVTKSQYFWLRDVISKYEESEYYSTEFQNISLIGRKKLGKDYGIYNCGVACFCANGKVYTNPLKILDFLPVPDSYLNQEELTERKEKEREKAIKEAIEERKKATRDLIIPLLIMSILILLGLTCSVISKWGG